MDGHLHYQVDLRCTMWDEWWSSPSFQGLVSVYQERACDGLRLFDYLKERD